MDLKLKSYLEKHDIKYKIHNHPPVFTVEEADKVKQKTIHVLHTKNLFLKDENKKFYLVSMYAYRKLDLKSLKEKLQAKPEASSEARFRDSKGISIKKLSFASPQQLKEYLNSTPGSVSIFGLINAKAVHLILDKQVWQAPIVGFHPNINTSTLELTHENLEKFYNSLKSQKEILDL
jgi:Ala-tRNA(Pro) deacylase